MQRYDLFVVEEYGKDDEKKKARYRNVGTAFDAKKGGGFDLTIAPGISVSGKLFARLPKEKGGGSADTDMLEDEIPY